MEKIKGIYMIKNKVNGTIYIGKSVNINARLKGHFSELEKGNGNKKIQKDYDIHGSNPFETKVLEVVDLSVNLEERETFYIQKFNSISKGYNCKTAKSEGYNGLATSLNDKYFKIMLNTAKKEGLTVAAWLRKIVIERIERNEIL